MNREGTPYLYRFLSNERHSSFRKWYGLGYRPFARLRLCRDSYLRSLQKLPTRFVIACNEMPNFVDPSGALSARLLLLDYLVSYEGREDRNLEKTLVAEVSGISNWALEGYACLKQRGALTVPAKSHALINEFRRVLDPTPPNHTTVNAMA